MSARRLALLLSTLALGAAGCGGGDDPNAEGTRAGDNALAESDIAAVLDARRTIDAACGSDGSAAADRPTAQLGEAAAAIAGITEQYPDRVYETGNEDRAEEMRTIAGQVSEQLRRCRLPADAERLATLAGDAG